MSERPEGPSQSDSASIQPPREQRSFLETIRLRLTHPIKAVRELAAHLWKKYTGESFEVDLDDPSDTPVQENDQAPQIFLKDEITPQAVTPVTSEETPIETTQTPMSKPKNKGIPQIRMRLNRTGPIEKSIMDRIDQVDKEKRDKDKYWRDNTEE